MRSVGKKTCGPPVGSVCNITKKCQQGDFAWTIHADHVYTVALTGILIFNFTYEKKLEEKCCQNYMKSILIDNFEI